jgi:hypothetical protein
VILQTPWKLRQKQKEYSEKLLKEVEFASLTTFRKEEKFQVVDNIRAQ